MKNITHIPKYECMTCHRTLDCSAPDSNEDPGAVPAKDDLSVCLYCGTLTKYDEHLNMIPLTEEELEQIKQEDPETFKALKHAQGVIHAMIRQN